MDFKYSRFQIPDSFYSIIKNKKNPFFSFDIADFGTMWIKLPLIVIYHALPFVVIHAFSNPMIGDLTSTKSSSLSSFSAPPSPSSTRLHLFGGDSNKKKTSAVLEKSNTNTRPIQFEASKNKKGNIFDSIFTGGAFKDTPSSDEILSSASSIASKIKSVKDLGWTKPPKRRGNARPRHRAWGGEGEMAIQDKANYDETRENCVEKWLTMEDFSRLTGAAPGPAADTVFVALAGGAKYAEREICEVKIAKWTGQSKTTTGAVIGNIVETLCKWVSAETMNPQFCNT